MVNEGTGFAKRSTWWDAFFLMLSGRGDEGDTRVRYSVTDAGTQKR
eukprot:COSAG04_NODE_7882_length_1052_cov_1.825813_1_plen_45_part_10